MTHTYGNTWVVNGIQLYTQEIFAYLRSLRIRMPNKSYKVQKPLVIFHHFPNKANKVMVNMGVMVRSLKLPMRHRRHVRQVLKGQRNSMLRYMAWMLVPLLRSYLQRQMKVLKGGLAVA